RVAFGKHLRVAQAGLEQLTASQVRLSCGQLLWRGLIGWVDFAVFARLIGQHWPLCLARRLLWASSAGCRWLDPIRHFSDFLDDLVHTLVRPVELGQLSQFELRVGQADQVSGLQLHGLWPVLVVLLSALDLSPQSLSHNSFCLGQSALMFGNVSFVSRHIQTLIQRRLRLSAFQKIDHHGDGRVSTLVSLELLTFGAASAVAAWFGVWSSLRMIATLAGCRVVDVPEGRSSSVASASLLSDSDRSAVDDESAELSASLLNLTLFSNFGQRAGWQLSSLAALWSLSVPSPASSRRLLDGQHVVLLKLVGDLCESSSVSGLLSAVGVAGGVASPLDSFGLVGGFRRLRRVDGFLLGGGLGWLLSWTFGAAAPVQRRRSQQWPAERLKSSAGTLVLARLLDGAAPVGASSRPVSRAAVALGRGAGRLPVRALIGARSVAAADRAAGVNRLLLLLLLLLLLSTLTSCWRRPWRRVAAISWLLKSMELLVLHNPCAGCLELGALIGAAARSRGHQTSVALAPRVLRLVASRFPMLLGVHRNCSRYSSVSATCVKRSDNLCLNSPNDFRLLTSVVHDPVEFATLLESLDPDVKVLVRGVPLNLDRFRRRSSVRLLGRLIHVVMVLRLSQVGLLQSPSHLFGHCSNHLVVGLVVELSGPAVSAVESAAVELVVEAMTTILIEKDMADLKLGKQQVSAYAAYQRLKQQPPATQLQDQQVNREKKRQHSNNSTENSANAATGSSKKKKAKLQEQSVSAKHYFYTEQFFGTYWERKPLLVKRNSPSHYDDWFSTADFDSMLRNHRVMFGEHLDVTSYRDARDAQPEGRALASQTWQFYQSGCSLRLLCPQVFHDRVYQKLSILHELFGSFVGANVYLTPPGTQGFAPHWDDIEAFVMQLEGRKHWRVYAPRSPNERLPRESSGNFGPKDRLGQPVIDAVLEPGDLLYMPRGFIHQGRCLDGWHSLHITVSTYQKFAWTDLLAEAISGALERATTQDEEFRRGLPLGLLGFAGSALWVPDRR
uniref:JmjC domain-containing protein n=1 Tax=Macrostomum lignano TaxID=282301 RepID=A0A1I8IKJ7_9PLAT